MKLSLKNVNQIYDGRQILENINFDIKDREFVSILGPSGCGKSTIFKMITGLEKNYSGEIAIDGINIKDYNGKLAYMPQNDLLLPWRRLYDNVKLPLEIEKADKKKIDEKIMELLPEFKLSGEENKFPSELSGGMRKRAALLRTFLINSDIMLLDEPFGALDAITKNELQDFLLEIWEKYKHTVLFITHDIDEAIHLSDKIIILGGQPTKVVKEMKIDFFRPRNKEIVLENKFLEYKREIMNLLK